MKFLRNRTKTASIAFVLMLTIAATFMTCLPAVNARAYDTYAYLTVTPNPIGVGQYALVTMFLNNLPPPPSATAGYARGNFENYTLTITKPGGTTETKVLRYADAVAAAWLGYVPDTVGTYQFVFYFPGQQFPGPTGNYYKPSTSNTVNLIVQQEPILQWPAAELPTDYWDRPIEAYNREWWTFAGNELQSRYNSSGSAWNPYTKPPRSAHIVWTRQIADGGLIGGEYGTASYYSGHTYEKKFQPVAIINGRLYYTQRLGSSSNLGLVCLDLSTGEQLWFKNGTTGVSLGQILEFESPNQHGGISYLWQTGSTYKMYDALSGEWILSLINARTGSVVYGPNGELLVYVLNGAQNWLAMWNSTKAIPSGTTISWRPPLGSATIDWRNGIQWNKTVPNVPGSQSVYFITPDVIYARASVSDANGYPVKCDVGYSIRKGDEARQMWVANRTGLQGQVGESISKGRMGDGVMCEFIIETKQWIGFDIYTGRQIWTSDPYESAWSIYRSAGTGALINNGKLYSTNFDGMCHIHDVKTGEEIATYYVGNAGFETPYGTWPYYQDVMGGGDLVFPMTSEHSPGSPLPRGYKLSAVDANTGDLVWKILGWFSEGVTADGYLATINSYDNTLYCFGKGKTATTVSAPTTSVTNGSTILIQGTVLDQSPGAAGTPAISDDNMTAWMEYLYMQNPCPADVKGVPVVLNAFRSDGTMINIGTATSDAYGHFSYQWCLPSSPANELYTIMATFAGSESYWTSWAVTGLSVVQAPQAAAPVEIPAYPDYTPMFTGIIIAVAIAIVIGLVNLFWKRK